MFSAKQQKNPVSRTISAPVRKDVRQRYLGQPSMYRVDRLADSSFEPYSDYRGAHPIPAITFTEFNPNLELKSVEFGKGNQYKMVSFRFYMALDPERDPVQVINLANPSRNQDYIALVDCGYGGGLLLRSLFQMESARRIRIQAVSSVYDDKEYNSVLAKQNTAIIDNLKFYPKNYWSNARIAGSLTKRDGKWVGYSEYHMHYGFTDRSNNQVKGSRYANGDMHDTDDYTYYLRGYYGIPIPDRILTEVCPRKETREMYFQGLKEFSQEFPNTFLSLYDFPIHSDYDSLSKGAKQAIAEGRRLYYIEHPRPSF